MIVMPDTEFAGAQTVCEAIRASVEELSIPHAGSKYGKVTISIGLTTAIPPRPGSFHELVHGVDGLLYEAKKNGRNRLVGLATLGPPAAAGRSTVDGGAPLPHAVAPAATSDLARG